MKKCQAKFIGEKRTCCAPATHLYGRVWLCAYHFVQANHDGNQGWDPKFGPCTGFSTHED